MKKLLWQFEHEDLGRIEMPDSVFGKVPVYRSRLRVTPFVRDGDSVREATEADGAVAFEATADLPIDLATITGNIAQARLQRDVERYGIPSVLLSTLLGHIRRRRDNVFPPERP